MKILEGIKESAYNVAKLFTSYVEKQADSRSFEEWISVELGALRARLCARRPGARFGGFIVYYPDAGETEMYTSLDRNKTVAMLADALAMHAEAAYGTPAIVEIRAADDDEKRRIVAEDAVVQGEPA